MKKLGVNLICAMIPSKKLRGNIRTYFSTDKTDNQTKKIKCIMEDIYTRARDDLSRKMSLVANDDVWRIPNGVKFYLPLYPWDFIQRVIAESDDFYEIYMLRSLREYIPNNAVILDIGANIGNHSIYFATVCGAKKVHSFEPVKNTYRMLVKNIEINELENIVTTHNVGLGDKASSGDILKMYAFNIGGTRIQETSGDNDDKYALRIERLDDMNLDLEKIDFVKIDVEEFELKTLVGMIETLRKHKPIVFIESFADKCEQVKEFFTKIGYGKPIEYSGFNWLFMPNKNHMN